MNRFQHPEYLQFLWLLLPMLFLFILYMRWRAKSKSTFASPHLWNALAPDSATSRHYTKFVFITLAIVALIFGIANPQIGVKAEKVKRRGIDVMIALDVSNSMLAQDVKPNRLDRAKLFISRFMDKLQNDRIGLIVFAGNAYQQIPLTTDYSTIKMYLPLVNTSMVPTQGTAIGEAVNKAIEGFVSNDEEQKALIIITDGDDHDSDAEDAIKDATSKGIKVFTIGVGEETGAPIPMGNDYKRDEKGEVVMTKFNREMLNSLAVKGNGQFYQLAAGNEIADGLIASLEKIESKELEDFQFSDYQSYFYVLLIIAVALMAMEYFVTEKSNHWAEKWGLFK